MSKHKLTIRKVGASVPRQKLMQPPAPWLLTHSHRLRFDSQIPSAALVGSNIPIVQARLLEAQPTGNASGAKHLAVSLIVIYETNITDTDPQLIVTSFAFGKSLPSMVNGLGRSGFPCSSIRHKSGPRQCIILGNAPRSDHSPLSLNHALFASLNSYLLSSAKASSGSLGEVAVGKTIRLRVAIQWLPVACMGQNTLLLHRGDIDLQPAFARCWTIAHMALRR